MITSNRLKFAVAIAAALALAACGQSSSTAPTTDNPKYDTNINGATIASTPEVAVDGYFGLYGDAASPTTMFGTYFITTARPPPMADRFPELPPGTIMIGSMWADVGNWYMRPVSPTRFEPAFEAIGNPQAVVFELDAAGAPAALTIEGLPNDQFGRRARIGDLPTELR